MLSLLQPHIREHLAEISRGFRQNRPFRHVVVDDFLDAGLCRRLMSEFPAFDSRRATNELGQVGRKAVAPEVENLGPAYAQFDGLMRDREFLGFMGELTGIDKLVYDPEYAGGGTHENLDGQDLDPHVDFNYHPSRPLHRRLNLIVFLNPEWDQSWGGCLELYGDPWSPSNTDSVMVVPLANRAVVFETTEASWHGFKRIRLPDGKNLTRRSIAVYFYTADRPAEETAASHGTIYVPRPLPDHLQAGHTLSPEDLHEVQLLMARRDAQVRYLYERELEFSRAMAGIMRSPSFRIGRLLTWPGRKLRELARGK